MRSKRRMLDKIRLFGPRVLIEHVKPEETGRLYIPDSSEKNDLHRIGRVLVVGDGREKGEVVPPLVQEGDLVVFQINDVIANTQKFKADGKMMLYLRQDDLLAKLETPSVTFDGMTMLGEYLMIEPRLNRVSNIIEVPDSVAKSNDFVYFTITKKGNRVTVPVLDGQEVIVNLGRVTPMFITAKGHVQREVGYIHQSYIHGCVDA